MRSTDRRRLAEQEAIATARGFVVVTFRGRDPDDQGNVRHVDLFLRFECDTLEAAREYRAALPPQAHGRRSQIYAVSREGYTIHVE